MKLLYILKESLFESVSSVNKEVSDMFEKDPSLANQVYDALGFITFPKKGTREYIDAENILEIEMMLDELKNKKLRGNFRFQDILVKALKLIGFNDKYVGWRTYYNVVSDLDTMIGIFGSIKEKEGYTQSEENLQDLLKLIKNHVNSSKISVITPQQKQQAVELYSKYIEKTGSKDLEGFLDFIKNKK